MELILTCTYLAILTILLLLVVTTTCSRHRAMLRWRPLLCFFAVFWIAMAVVKKTYIDEFQPPNDGLIHEAAARTVADLILAGNFSELWAFAGVGNPAYQFALGIFYAVSAAPEVVTYAINGALAYWGLLSLLEILSRHTSCRRLPTLVVLLFGLLPSALLWTTKNLKEGVVLWGICMMCHLAIPIAKRGNQPQKTLPLVGALAVAAMRPHIAMAWLLAIGGGALVHSKKFAWLFFGAAAAIPCVWALSVLRPEIFEQVYSDGATSALSGRYERLSDLDSLGRAPISGENPIPVLSGLELILFRPWPSEADSAVSFLAGAEVWLMATFGLTSWMLNPGMLRKETIRELSTYLLVALFLGFFFSYMYNMGLAVRQRLMCFPAVLAIYTWPLLAKTKVSKPSIPAWRKTRAPTGLSRPKNLSRANLAN